MHQHLQRTVLKCEFLFDDKTITITYLALIPLCRLPLHHAARQGQYEIVVKLLQANGNQTVNARRDNGA